MKIKSKKSQADQIFVWAIAAIMMTLLLLFGYRAIKGLSDRGEQVQYIEFQNQLKSTVEGTRDYGSERRVSFNAPVGFKKVCFVRTYPDLPSQDVIPSDYPIIKDQVQSRVKDANVFLIKDITEESFYIGDVDVDGDILCIEVVRGEVNIRIKGFGRYAKIFRD